MNITLSTDPKYVKIIPDTSNIKTKCIIEEAKSKNIDISSCIGMIDLKGYTNYGVEGRIDCHKPEVRELFKHPIEIKTFSTYIFEPFKNFKETIKLDKITQKIITDTDILLKQIYILININVRLKRISHSNQTIDNESFF